MAKTKTYLHGLGTRETPQSEAIPGSGQVPNSAGGYAWEVDDFGRLARFPVLGSEGGTYYAGERGLTRENADVVRRCVKQDGIRTVGEVAKVSVQGRAPKNDPALLALAIAASEGDPTTRKFAFQALPDVARTGTHLFEFLSFVQEGRGWGRSLRRAVADWYLAKDPDALAYQLVKYRQRFGWTHRDALRKAHPKPADEAQGRLLRWAAGKAAEGEVMPLAIEAYEQAQRAETAKDTVRLIEHYGDKLPRESIKTEHLQDPAVWEALLTQGMPMTALIRNLATLTRVGVVTPMSVGAKVAEAQLLDSERPADLGAAEQPGDLVRLCEGERAPPRARRLLRGPDPEREGARAARRSDVDVAALLESRPASARVQPRPAGCALQPLRAPARGGARHPFLRRAGRARGAPPRVLVGHRTVRGAARCAVAPCDRAALRVYARMGGRRHRDLGRRTRIDHRNLLGENARTRKRDGTV